MALHKNLAEIRALPYPEYVRWKLFYLLEPFGWGAHHALLYNINRDPKGRAKDEDDLLNDRAQELIKALQAQSTPDLSDMSLEERRNYLIRQAKKDLGIK